jgi:hypothetical protein
MRWTNGQYHRINSPSYPVEHAHPAGPQRDINAPFGRGDIDERRRQDFKPSVLPRAMDCSFGWRRRTIPVHVPVWPQMPEEA